jgi:hypothetical protein
VLGGTARWRRALSRRQFLETAAGATGAVLGSGLRLSAPALAGHHADPRPIPGTSGTDFNVHFNFSDPADEPHHEPSLITDFHGFIGAAEVEGTGMGTGFDEPLRFTGDLRFMNGEYIGVDGRRDHGTFAFI